MNDCISRGRGCWKLVLNAGASAASPRRERSVSICAERRNEATYAVTSSPWRRCEGGKREATARTRTRFQAPTWAHLEGLTLVSETFRRLGRAEVAHQSVKRWRGLQDRADAVAGSLWSRGCEGRRSRNAIEGKRVSILLVDPRRDPDPRELTSSASFRFSNTSTLASAPSAQRSTLRRAIPTFEVAGQPQRTRTTPLFSRRR